MKPVIEKGIDGNVKIRVVLVSLQNYEGLIEMMRRKGLVWIGHGREGFVSNAFFWVVEQRLVNQYHQPFDK